MPLQIDHALGSHGCARRGRRVGVGKSVRCSVEKLAVRLVVREPAHVLMMAPDGPAADPRRAVRKHVRKAWSGNGHGSRG